MTLKVTGVVRQYPGNAEATLNEVSFELPEGTLTALLGKSGAGKSTLLRCVMGLEPFERGTIEIDGVVVRGTAESSPSQRQHALHRARERLGLVFQNFELFPHLSVLDNCTLALIQVKGQSQAAATAKAREVLIELGLEQRIDVWPEQLSGGQKQRVAIARALCMAPRVLLYDEPTSALDPSLKAEVLQTLQRVDATGVTQVVVTHDIFLARGMEHVCVLDHGRVIESGPPAQVLTTPLHQSTRQLLKHWQ